MSRFPKEINDLIKMAAIYYEDGAPGSAALRLSKAAAKMQEIAEQRNALLGFIAPKAEGTHE